MTQKDFMPPNGESLRNGRSDQGGLLDEAKNVASHLTSEAKDEASSRVASQKDRAAKSLSSVAEALRGTKHELDDSMPAIGEYADKAADTVQQLSDYIRSKNVGELIDSVEHFARRESALFLGGTAALGLLAGRFLRSSRPGGGGRDYDRNRNDYRYEREGRDFGGRDENRYASNYRSGSADMGERSRSVYGSDVPMGGKIGNMSGSSSSSSSTSGTSGMGVRPNVGQSSGMGSATSGSNIGVQKVGTQSNPPAGAGQAAQRDVTKPGGFTPSTAQGSNFGENAAGTGAATGSNMPPKKGPEVK